MSGAELSIGELGKATGTKNVTIRYYEKIGLLPEPPRTAANYRAYGAADRDRLRFIRRCRNLGFSLDQVRELLRLAAQTGGDCAAVDRMAGDHLAAIEHKIADLQRLAEEMRRIRISCQGGRLEHCHIIEALAPEAAGRVPRDTNGR